MGGQVQTRLWLDPTGCPAFGGGTVAQSWAVWLSPAQPAVGLRRSPDGSLRVSYSFQSLSCSAQSNKLPLLS